LAPVDSPLRPELDELVARMCKALNDPTRLLLLYALRTRGHTVTELCELVLMRHSNTSRHLAVLRDRGLVRAERQGNTVVYSLRHPKVIDAIDILRGLMSEELALQTPSGPRSSGVNDARDAVSHSELASTLSTSAA